ncbi:MAG: hypothetical protein K1X82_02120 [Bacteroidia bacterium]|nr:hypothetical protein [Bacteroidia bacterium]
MKAAIELEKEAIAISIYLLGKPCSSTLVERYIRAHQKHEIKLEHKDVKLWKWALNGRFWMACIDSGLALVQPKSPIRRKIFTMLAILEASVENTSFFLPTAQSPFVVWVKLFQQGVKAVFFSLLGLVLVKLI